MRKANLILAALAALEAGGFLLALRSFGFPDGHLTELDRFRRVSYPVTVALLVVLAVVATRVRAKPALALFVALNVVAFAVDGFAARVFDHGAGG